MENTLDFAKEIQINVNELDIEWLKQPELFLEVAQGAADAKLDADRLKEVLDRTNADLNLEVRGDPERFGLDTSGRGPTEGAIHAVILSHPKYTSAKDEYLQAVHRMDILNAAVRAFDHRRAALERLVILHGQSYFAGPREPRQLDPDKLKGWREEMTTNRVREAREKHAGPRRRRRQENTDAE